MARPAEAAKPSCDERRPEDVAFSVPTTGVVAWNGAIYPGRHEPLISVEVWQKVQDLLDQRRVGEKARRHQSYLKSTVYCGDQKSRMIITHAKSQTGAIYPNFICSGRHARRTACQRRRCSSSVEQSIIDLRRTKLPDEAAS